MLRFVLIVLVSPRHSGIVVLIRPVRKIDGHVHRQFCERNLDFGFREQRAGVVFDGG